MRPQPEVISLSEDYSADYSRNWITEYPDVDREYMETYPLDFRPFEPEVLFKKKNLNIYIHVPFCATHCSFCTFLHFDRSTTRINAYVPDVLKEIDLWFGANALNNYQISSIFFGGGTATTLSAEQITQVLDKLRSVATLANDAEITVESHPNTINKRYLTQLRAAGVNRMTYGIQSFNDTHLGTMEIIQTAERNKRTLALTKSMGFDSVCMDLMFALPGQSLADLAQDLETFFEFDLDGISCYRYVIDPENRMPAEKKRQLLSLAPSEQGGNEMYHYLVERLTEHRYVQYTQPDFAKPDKICRYTSAVWKAPQEEQLGLGVGALSYNINNYSLVNTHDLHEYADCIAAGRLPILLGTQITPDELMRKYFVLGIKCLEVDTRKFEQLYGIHHQVLFHDELRKLERLGMVVEGDGVIRLTAKGKIYVDYVCKQFYSYRNKGLSQPDGYKFREMRIRSTPDFVQSTPIITLTRTAILPLEVEAYESK